MTWEDPIGARYVPGVKGIDEKDWRYYRNMRDRWNDRIGSWLLERFPWLGILL